MTKTAPIVGAHFRPPATTLINYLPIGAKLRLQPEPENPYDDKAVKVLVEADAFPNLDPETEDGEAFNAALEMQGSSIEDIKEKSPIHLCYIARTHNPDWQTISEGYFFFSAEGKPMISEAPINTGNPPA